MHGRNFSALMSAVLLVSLFVGCGKTEHKKVKKGQVTDEVYLQTPGFFILSNRNEFMAVGVKTSASRYMTLRLAKSADGITWTNVGDGLMSSNGGYDVDFHSDRISIGRKDEKVAMAYFSFFDATNTAIAAIDGVDIIPDDSLAKIKVKQLSFYQMGTNRFEKFVKDQVDHLR